MSARLLSFVIWAAVAASAVFWGLRVSVSPPRTPAHAATASDAAPRGDLSRLLGAAPVATANAPAAAEPALASRFKLLGVAAPRPPGAAGGVALISVDGKPARAYRSGASVEGELVLQSVRSRGASLGPQGAAPRVELELPPLPVAATGSLPPAGSNPSAAPAPGGPGSPPQPMPTAPVPVMPSPGQAPGPAQDGLVPNPEMPPSGGVRRDQ